MIVFLASCDGLDLVSIQGILRFARYCKQFRIGTWGFLRLIALVDIILYAQI